MSQPTTPDPFASMGGGVYVNGGWVPANHPLASQAKPEDQPGYVAPAAASAAPAPNYAAPAAPTTPVAPAAAPAAPAAAAPTSPDPFASIGGGTFVNGGWIPTSNTEAIAAAQAKAAGLPVPGSLEAAQAALTSTSTPGSTTSTLSSTPPPAVTTPAGQAAWESILQKMMSQDPNNVSLTDPALKPQDEQFRASAERARAERQAAMSEYYGAQGLDRSGAMDADVASSYNDMGQQVGDFESQLVAKELQNQRDEISGALQIYGAQLSAEQKNALQAKLAQLDAALNAQIASGNLALGQSRLGLDYASTEADNNYRAMMALLNTGATQA